MSKSLKKLIDINRLRTFKELLVGVGSAYVQTGAVDQTVAGTKTFSEPIVGSVTGSSGSCTGNAATATKLAAKRTIALSGAATGTATGFDGSGNITIPVTSLDASKLTGTASVSTTGNAATATTATTATNATYTNWLRTSSHSDHLFHTEWDKAGYFWTYVTTGDGDYRAVRVARSDSAATAQACTGNAATATQFSANATVALTGDATGTSAGSKKGWSVPVTLANSGVTAGTYGPSADVTGNNNATISVPEITVDAKGRVTSVVNRTLTCKNNTYTVNNATLTIQKNGTNVATFTSNASSNATANITVPTKVSELTNDSGFLTSHQSLSNYVTLNGAQTISGAKTFTGNVIGINKDSSTENANDLYSTTAGSKLTYYTTSNGSTRLTNVPDATNTTLESRTIRRLSDSDWNVEQICHNSNGLYYRKGINGTWGAWKTFAFTDSNISGNAATATTATTAKACTGNAATATKLQTARTINGTGFNGTANITTANWGTARNISITDGTNTSTAVSVNGSANVSLNLPATIKANLTGNCSGSSGSCTGNAATATTATTAKACTGNAATATKLATARSLWGNNFDGSAAITGTISGTPGIELMPAATAEHGGFLDFHYNHSTADYTSRIIESASGTLSINNVTITTGKVVTATTFDGALKGNVTGNCSGSSGSCTGNAATATTATTAKSCTGNAATATKLATKRTIALSGAATGTATGFDGSGNITIPVTSLDASKLTGTASVNTTGNAATATKAANGVDSQGENWIRFINGVQICWAKIPCGPNGSSSWTYGASFSSAPVVTVCDNGKNTNTVYLTRAGNIGTTSCVIVMVISSSGSYKSGEAQCIAIGRWK